MAEEYVNKDQHRADLAELRLELTEALHGLRQDLTVLMKVVELGFGDLRRDLAEQRRELNERTTGLRQDMADVRQEMRAFRSTMHQQMWVIVGGVILALLKMTFFP